MKKGLVILVITLAAFQINAQTQKLGIITDHEKSAEIDSIFQIIVEEINKTTGPAWKFVLDPTDGISYGISHINEAQSEYQRIAQTSDYIIILGAKSLKGISDLNSFPVPTLAIGIIDPVLQDLPNVNGITGIENFSYIWSAKDLNEELAVFKQVVPFENLTILVNETSSSVFNEEKGMQYIKELEENISASISILEIGSDLETSLGKLLPDTDAIYLSDLQGKSDSDLSIIAESLKEQKLPSFSSQNRHVENGILACISDENDFSQTIRRLAIMVDESIDGEALSQMPVNINFKEGLFINSRTLKAIEVPLSFEILFTANFIDYEEDYPVYSLAEVMELALEKNFGIKISNQDISLAIQDAKLAKTAYLPSLDLGFNGRQINESSAAASIDQPERKLSGDLGLSQLIYSEEAIAGIKIAYYLQKAQESITESQVLQIYMNTYLDYFAVLAAKTALQIETENLENLKTNLELARVRVSSGSASEAEIFRWESEVSTASQMLVESNTNLINTKNRLNTSLANSLEKEFDIADISVDDDLYKQYSENSFAQYVSNPSDIEVVSMFLVNESVSNNPNKQALLQQIKAIERKNLSNKRLFYTPNIALQAGMQQTLARGGAGSDVSEFNIPNNQWNVGVGLSFPILSANKRRVNRQTSRIQLEQLENSKFQLDQELELAVKTSLTNTVATSTNIEFSKVSSNNAEANFELVRNQYQVGEVNITQLIDAQQTSLIARQRHALAIYDYLQSQLQLEYSVGFFSMQATQEELQEFNNRFMNHITN
ncbi:MAG: ABC transporter substrate binding protein [Desulfobulbia bacterium]